MFLLDNGASEEKTALISDRGERISYGGLRQDAARFRSSVSRRHLVIILMDNTVETLRFYCAALSGGGVPLLLGKNPGEALHRYIDLYHPRYIWAGSQWQFRIPVAAAYAGESHTLYRTEFPAFPMDEELALLLTTSGSTGNPKTVRLSRQNLRENAAAAVEALQITADARGVTTLPMNYTYGMIICHMHLIAGGALLVTEQPVYSPGFHAFLQKEKITNIQGVPYIHEMLDRVGFYRRIPEELNLVTMGGGKAKEDLQRRLNTLFARHGIRFCALYGQTEGTTMLTRLPDSGEMNPPDCIGVACRGMRAEIDPETGELIFYGTSVCLGYAEGFGDLANGDENGGVLHTGDLARMDAQGRIYLMGRIRRFVKMSGVRMNMDDIEQFVCRWFTGADCGVCGGDNALKVFVAGAEEEEVKRRICKTFGVSHLMLRVVCLPEIPRSASGKKDYRKLEQML